MGSAMKAVKRWDADRQATGHRPLAGLVATGVRAALAIAILAWGGSGVWGQSSPSQGDLWSRSGQDWPQFLGPGRNGASSETGILTDWSAGKLKLLWSLPTGKGYGMGTVAAGRFFHVGLYGDETVLKCLRAETGEVLWQFRYSADYRDLYGYDSGPRASPVIDGDRVYLYGVEGQLHCLATETGKLIWKVDTAEDFGVIQNFFGVGSTPLIYKDQLLVMVGGSPADDRKLPPGALNRVTPDGSGIVSFDKRTGAVRYRTISDLASYSSPKLMEIDGQPVALAWMRSGLWGWDPDSGDVRFSFPYRARMLESVNAATPVVIGNRVFLSECYQLGSVLLNVAAAEPEIVWSDREARRRPVMETHWNTGVVLDDWLFASSGRHSNGAELRCINWKTGELQWAENGLGRSSCLLIDGHLIVQGEFGSLQLVRATPEGYQVVTKYDPATTAKGIEFQAPCWAAPIVSHGLMWVRGRDQLACFELIPPATGQ